MQTDTSIYSSLFGKHPVVAEPYDRDIDAKAISGHHGNCIKTSEEAVSTFMWWAWFVRGFLGM